MTQGNLADVTLCSMVQRFLSLEEFVTDSCRFQGGGLMAGLQLIWSPLKIEAGLWILL